MVVNSTVMAARLRGSGCPVALRLRQPGMWWCRCSRAHRPAAQPPRRSTSNSLLTAHIDHSRAVHHFYATGTGRHQRGQPARFLQSQPGKSWQMLRVHVGGDRLDHVLGGFAGRALHHDKQTGLVSCARKRMPGTEALPGIPPLLRVIARAPVTKRPWTIARRPTVYFPLMANRLPRTQRRSVPEKGSSRRLVWRGVQPRFGL
jgi:hypothetical protein